MIDKEDYEKVAPFKWVLGPNGPVTLVPQESGTFYLLLTRFVMGVEGDPKATVYRLTDNILDCRKKSLSLTPRGYQLNVPGRWDKWFEHKEELDEYGFPRV